VLQHLAAVLGHVELLGMVVEHVVDEPRGQVEKVFTVERLQGLFDVHVVLDDAIEHEVANLVVVEGFGEHALGGVAEGRAAVAAGGVLAAGDLQIGDGLVDDGANPARHFAFPTAVFAALRTGGLLGGTGNGYKERRGCIRTHACVLC
jgi:hypothetical protein